MYNGYAVELRLCTALRADGRPCRGWAMWGDPEQRCNVHAGRHHRGSMNGSTRQRRGHNYPPCTCVAYAWPHRPGGGLCRWPLHPTHRLTTPAGTHGEFYWRSRSRPRW
jgi:hypothetical protein